MVTARESTKEPSSAPAVFCSTASTGATCRDPRLSRSARLACHASPPRPHGEEGAVARGGRAQGRASGVAGRGAGGGARASNCLTSRSRAEISGDLTHVPPWLRYPRRWRSVAVVCRGAGRRLSSWERAPRVLWEGRRTGDRSSDSKYTASASRRREMWLTPRIRRSTSTSTTAVPPALAEAALYQGAGGISPWRCLEVDGREGARDLQPLARLVVRGARDREGDDEREERPHLRRTARVRRRADALPWQHWGGGGPWRGWSRTPS